MTEKKRLQIIKEICESRHSFQGYLFSPTEEDINDELGLMECRPDPQEPQEEIFAIMDAVFEGGQ